MKLDYKKSKLKNGVRVLSIPMESTEAVTSLILFGTGSHYETKKLSGISHYLEHLVFKGSKKYPTSLAISTLLDGLGASYNAFTGEEETGFYVKVVRDKVSLALDVMSDFLKHPRFVPAEIERERGVILEELRMYRDIPQQRALELFQNILYGDQPAGRNIGGSEISVPNIKRADIIEYFNKHYRGDNIVAVFAGNISHAESVRLAQKYLASLPAGKSYTKESVMPPKEIGVRVKVEKRSSDQTHLALGFGGLFLLDKRRYALDVLSVVLGGGMSSRLFYEVRERRGLAYDVRASSSYGTDLGNFLIYAGVNNEKAHGAIDVIIDELKKVKRTLVSANELNKAKNSIEGHTLLGIETSNAVAAEYGGQEVLLGAVETPHEYVRKIKKVTAYDVRSVAKDIFTKRTVRLAAVGPSFDRKLLERSIIKVG